MSTDVDVEMSFADMAKATLSEPQRNLLANKPTPLREAVYQRIEASLRLSARLQMKACYGSGIHQVIFERVLLEEQRRLDADVEHHQVLTRLIQGGASFMVMRTVLGTDKATFTRIRKALGTNEPSRQQIDDLLSASIYRQWEALGRSISAEVLLQLHDFSSKPISAIWNLLQDWQQIDLKVKGRN